MAGRERARQHKHIKVAGAVLSLTQAHTRTYAHMFRKVVYFCANIVPCVERCCHLFAVLNIMVSQPSEFRNYKKFCYLEIWLHRSALFLSLFLACYLVYIF